MHAQLTLHTNADQASPAASSGTHLATTVLFDAFGNVILRQKDHFRKGPTHALELPWVTIPQRIPREQLDHRFALKYRMPLQMQSYAGCLRASGNVFHLYRSHAPHVLPEHFIRVPHNILDAMEYVRKFQVNGSSYILSLLAFRTVKLLMAHQDEKLLHLI